MAVHEPMFQRGEQVTIDDQMRAGQFLRRITKPAGEAFGAAVEPLAETHGDLYAIEFVLCHVPRDEVVVCKRPAVLGISL